jgi:centrosomal protein CEP104
MDTLTLKVAICSSEEPSRPSSNLNIKQQGNPGWQSAPNSPFPVDIVFQIIEGPCHLRSLHILSHEYKIASRIELHLGIPKNGVFANTVDECDFIVLGYIYIF